MTSLQEQQPVALRESSQSTTTDPFMLELPASPIGDPQYIGKPLEVDRDEWLGQHYLNCIIAQMLLRNSSTSEEVSLFNDRLAHGVAGFAYDKCYEFFREQDIRPFDENTAGTTARSISYQRIVLAWTGAIVRRGEAHERSVLLLGLRRFGARDTWPTNLLIHQQSSASDLFDTFSGSMNTASAATHLAVGASNDTEKEPATLETTLSERPVTPAHLPVPSMEDSPQESSETPLSYYTSALWEHLASVGGVPIYLERKVSISPPCFHAVATYGTLRGEGQGKNKKTAKHQASKALCALMRIQVV